MEATIQKGMNKKGTRVQFEVTLIYNRRLQFQVTARIGDIWITSAIARFV